MNDITQWLVSASTLLLIVVLTSVTTYHASTGAIPPNTFLGIRVGPIDSSEQVWRKSHRKALPWMFVAGGISVGFILASIVMMSDPELRISLVVWGFFSLLSFGSVAVIIAYVEAKKLAKVCNSPNADNSES